MKQVNAVAYHPYTPNARGSYEIYNEFKEVVSSYGFGNKIWITEIGYPMQGSYGTEVAEEKMPLEVLKTITLLAAGGAQRIFWYELFDHGSGGNPSDSEHWFGLLNRDDFSKKGGADAYQLCALNFPGRTLRTALPERSGETGDVAAYYFEGSDGKHTLVIWSNRLSRLHALTVTLPGSNQMEWNIRTGIAASIGERSQWTLQKEAAGELDFTQLRFFTWENTDRSKPPRISAN